MYAWMLTSETWVGRWLDAAHLAAYILVCVVWTGFHCALVEPSREGLPKGGRGC